MDYCSCWSLSATTPRSVPCVASQALLTCCICSPSAAQPSSQQKACGLGCVLTHLTHHGRSQQLIWTPCAFTSVGLAPLLQVKQRGKASSACSWARYWQMLLATSLLFLGQRGPPGLYSLVYHVHMPEQWKSGKLRVHVRGCLTTNTWTQTLNSLQKGCPGALCFQIFVPTRSSYLVLLSKLY